MLELVEGFDDGAWADLFGVTGSPTVHADYGAHGKGIRLGDNTGTALTLDLRGLQAEGVGFVLGFAVRIDDEDGGHDIVKFAPSSDFDVRWNDTASVFEVYVDGGSTADIAWSSGVVDGSVWHYHELHVINGRSTNGTVKWYLDGGLVDEWVANFDFGGVAMSASVQFAGTFAEDIDEASYDDIYLLNLTGGVNDSALGPIEAVHSLPDGNGTTSNLTGQDADKVNNYLNVDEDPPDDGTTYNESGTEGDKDTYDTADLTGTPIVKGVVVRLSAAKTDTGVKAFRAVVRSGGTDYVGASQVLAETYDSYDTPFDEDPDTATTWLYGGVNSAEFGGEVRDS